MTRPVVFEDLEAEQYQLPSAITDKLMTPALVVHMDKVRANVQQMLKYVGGKPNRWRPHLKTTKIPQVWAELLHAGLRRFKVATTRELAVLCEVARDCDIGGIDVLVAYPLIGPALARVADIAEAYSMASISVLCEDEKGVGCVPPRVGIFIDVNVGMDRSGMPLEEAQLTLVKLVAAAESDCSGRFRGLHCYEGHLSQPDLEERKQAAHKVYKEVMQLVAGLEGEGYSVKELITSGTPGFQSALSFMPFTEQLGPEVHQISPGTTVFHDLMVESRNADIDLQPAAVLMARVVSRPSGGTVTVDAGSKSLAAEAGNPAAFVIGRPGWRPMHCSEEHMPIQLATDGTPPPSRGSIVALIPMHICPTVNLAEEALLVDVGPDGGRTYTVVPVSGRGHELMGSGLPSLYRPPEVATTVPNPPATEDKGSDIRLAHNTQLREGNGKPRWKRQRTMPVG